MDLVLILWRDQIVRTQSKKEIEAIALGKLGGGVATMLVGTLAGERPCAGINR